MAMLNYTKRNVHQRNAKAKAIQLTLNNYFKWAKDRSIDFHAHSPDDFDITQRDYIVRWLAGGMPKLRVFSETIDKNGLFQSLLSALKEDCYQNLVDIRIASPGYHHRQTSQDERRFSMPNLRVARFKHYHTFLPFLDAPNLHHLIISRIPTDELETFISLLTRFEFLTELVIGKLEGPSDCASFDERLIALRQLVFHHDLRYCNRPTRSFFADIHCHCPNALDWTVSVWPLYIYNLRPELRFDHVISLTITTERSWDGFNLGQLLKPRSEVLLGHFPNLTRLCLACLVDTAEPRLSFERAAEMVPGGVAFPHKWVTCLVECLGVESEDDYPVFCPRLERLELLDTVFYTDLLLLLATCLRVRQALRPGSNEALNGCLITIRRCMFSPSVDTGYERPIDIRNMAFPEFQQFSEDLLRPSSGPEDLRSA
jgi:hypothetical protein